jgi:hypothetical protein
MAALFVMVTLALGSAALLFRTAHEQVYFGTTWAVDACSASQMFCSHPEYLAYAAGCTLILAIGTGIGRAVSGD